MSEKIIVVEDDIFSQQFYKFLLEKHGYLTLITDDVDAVLKELEETRPVLIIMDVNLTNSYLNGKKIDGIEFSKFIKSNPKYREIPILIITAHSYESEKKKILEDSEANGIFPKPIYDFNKLLNTINELKQNLVA